MLIAVPSFAQTRLIDNAGVLSFSEKGTLASLIDSLSAKYGFDLVIVIERNIGAAIPVNYADDFFDNNGYGKGSGRDGCLFLHVTESRDYWFSTSGRGINILNEAALDKLNADVKGNLRDGKHFNAYKSFLNDWDKFLALDAKGMSYNFLQQWNAVIMIIVWALAFGIGFIVVSSWKSGMNTVFAKTKAAAYIVPDSLVFIEKKDTLLYSKVTKTDRQPKAVPVAVGSGSGGRGRTHTSSSGRSHGGGGGKY